MMSNLGFDYKSYDKSNKLSSSAIFYKSNKFDLVKAQ